MIANAEAITDVTIEALIVDSALALEELIEGPRKLTCYFSLLYWLYYAFFGLHPLPCNDFPY